MPLVGPSSLLLTLMASGLDGQHFRFTGYLPIADADRREALLSLERESARGETILFIETPYRNRAMLESLLEVLRPDTRLCVAQDVTGKNRIDPHEDDRGLEGRVRRRARTSQGSDRLCLPRRPAAYAGEGEIRIPPFCNGSPQ